MQMDIAVESVLTANGAMHALLTRLVRRVDAVVGHSTGEHSAALVTGVLDVGTDERLRAFSQGLYRAYADAASRHDVPGAVLLAIGAGADRVEEIAREAGGELHLAMDNCPHQAVLVGRRAPPRAGDRGACGVGVRGAALRPRRPHADVRPVRRRPARGVRGARSRPAGPGCGPARPRPPIRRTPPRGAS